MTEETRKSARLIHEESKTSLAWFQFAKVIKDTLPHWAELRVVAEKTKAAGRAPFDYLLNRGEEELVLAALPGTRKKRAETDEPAEAAAPAEDAAVPEVCDTAEPSPAPALAEPEPPVPSPAAAHRAIKRTPKPADLYVLLAGVLDTHAKHSRQAVETLAEGLAILRAGEKTRAEAEDAKDERITELTEELGKAREENARLAKELAIRPVQPLWGRRTKPNAGCER